MFKFVSLFLITLFIFTVDIYPSHSYFIEGGYFNNNDSNYSIFTTKYQFLRENDYEVKIYADFKEFDDSDHYDFNVELDAFYSNTVSPFAFFYSTYNNESSDNDYEYYQVGLGFAFFPEVFQVVDKFPFYNKFSLAYIQEVDEDDYLSFRYKFKLSKDKVNITLTHFIYSHGYKTDIAFSYNLSEQIYLQYEIFEEYRNLSETTVDYYSNFLKLGYQITI